MLTIHFLNVGHGDTTIIEHPSGRITMIDINNGSSLDKESFTELAKAFNVDEGWYNVAMVMQPQREKVLKAQGYSVPLTNPLEFLQENYAGRDIFRYIQSHPDLDHMRGLRALQVSAFNVGSFWDTEHSKVPKFGSDADRDDWTAYQAFRSGQASGNVLCVYRGEKNFYYNQDFYGDGEGDNIEILSPTPELVYEVGQTENYNNLSYALRVTHKGIRILLPGDLEESGWDSLVDAYGADLKCDVLAASHHGRDSGYYEAAVALMKPTYTVVSVGKKPDTDATNKYRRHSNHVWSTRWYGNITLTVDDDGRGNLASQIER